MSAPSDAFVESQANSDQCEPVDHAIIFDYSDVDEENSKPGTFSYKISMNDLLHPPDAVLLNYFDAELEINCALEADQKNEAISEAQLICCDLLNNSDDTIKLARRICVKNIS